jgi:hypothetical protein
MHQATCTIPTVLLHCWMVMSLQSLLTVQDKQCNRLHSGTRCTFEQGFSALKLYYHMAKVRDMGLTRNHTQLELMRVAHNIKRALSIRQASCS